MSTVARKRKAPGATRPPSGRKAPKPPKALDAVGVEIDGATVRSVLVRSGRATAFRTYDATSLDASLSAWARELGRVKGPVRVAWSAGGFFARGFLPDLPEGVLAAAVAQSAEDAFPLDPSSVLAAGAVAPRRAGPDGLDGPGGPGSDGDREGEGPSAGPGPDEVPVALVAVDRAELAGIWPRLRRLGATCVPTPLLLGADGMYLLLDSSGTYMALVEDGFISEYRPCSVGGLDWGSAESVADAAGPFLEMLVPEVSAAASSWSRQGHYVPPSVFALGPGSGLADLPHALAKAGLSILPPPIPPGIDVVEIPVAEQAAAVVALAAAATTPGPAATFVDPAFVADQATAASRTRRRRILAAVVAVLVIGGGASAWSIHSAQRSAANARAAEAAARAKADGVTRWLHVGQRVSALSAEAARVRAASPNFEKHLAPLMSSAPHGTVFSSLSVQKATHGISVQVSASIPGSNFAPVASWVKSLEKAGVSPVDLQSWSVFSGGHTVRVSFTATSAATTKKKG